MSIYQQMNGQRRCGISIYYTMELLPSLKNDEFLPFEAMWMDLENIMLGEVNQRKTDII